MPSIDVQCKKCKNIFDVFEHTIKKAQELKHKCSKCGYTAVHNRVWVGNSAYPKKWKVVPGYEKDQHGNEGTTLGARIDARKFHWF